MRAHRSRDLRALAATARAMREATLAEMLDRGAPSERLAAARAARFAGDRLALVAPLARAMAAGDDALSPAAARALLAIVARVPPGDALEHAPSDVRDALAPALALADAPGARADLRAAAAALRSDAAR